MTWRTRQVLDLRGIVENPSLHFNEFFPPHPGFFSQVLALRPAITILHSLPPRYSFHTLLAFLPPLSLSVILFLSRSVAAPASASDEKPG